ncbi:MAG TPA: hypothetical protein VFC18_06080 [Burkholderiales bacterium]|nr:hypothetical protein [Burkholderiales bacterium]
MRASSEGRQVYVAKCRCSRVVLQAQGPPLAHICCYCDDCQAAARKIDAREGGCSGQGPDGGTPSLLFRRDRIRFVQGEELLTVLRVREPTHTDRLIAACCNTAITQRHYNGWPHCGVKSHLFEPPIPPLELRIYTRYAPDPSAVSRDVPCARGASLRLVRRLLPAALALKVVTLRRRA